jgi:putative PIN family toxin of toxin-antitoxin system
VNQRAVLDTNVLVSALLWRGIPHRCLLAAEAGLYDSLTAEPILDELRTKLIEKFGHTPREAAEAVSGVARAATTVALSGRGGWVLADPDDDKFIETALDGHADVVVSGDHHLLDLGTVEGVRIVTPREFLGLLASNLAGDAP